MLNLLIFALIGFAGAALARMFIPVLQALEPLPVMMVGLAGAVLGGLISWYVWPALNVDYHYSGFLMAMLGAAIVVWGYSAYLERSNA